MPTRNSSVGGRQQTERTEGRIHEQESPEAQLGRMAERNLGQRGRGGGESGGGRSRGGNIAGTLPSEGYEELGVQAPVQEFHPVTETGFERQEQEGGKEGRRTAAGLSFAAEKPREEEQQQEPERQVPKAPPKPASRPQALSYEEVTGINRGGEPEIAPNELEVQDPDSVPAAGSTLSDNRQSFNPMVNIPKAKMAEAQKPAPPQPPSEEEPQEPEKSAGEDRVKLGGSQLGDEDAWMDAAKHVSIGKFTREITGTHRDAVIPHVEMADDVVPESAAQTRETIKKGFSEKNLEGNGLRAPVGSSTKGGLMFEDVSIPLSLLQYAVAQRNSNAIGFLQEQLAKNGVEMETGEISAAINDGSIEQIVNRANNVEVFTSKYPVNENTDAHIRRLKIHSDTDGMKLHPLAAKMMNADHDGDELVVSLTSDMLIHQPHVMDLLIAPRGNISLDFDFFSQPYSNREIVNQWVELSIGNANVNSIVGGRIANIVEKLVNKQVAEDDVPKQWKTVFQLFVNGCHLVGRTDAETRRAVSNFITRLYHATFKTARIQALEISDNQFDPNDYRGPILDPEEKHTPEDRANLDYIDRCVEGEVPLNWQAYQNFMNRELGRVAGKNRDFRITASAGKNIKLTPDMMIGDEYVINEANFYKFASRIVDFKYAAVMSSRMKATEQQEYIAQLVRDMVLYPTELAGEGEEGEEGSAREGMLTPELFRREGNPEWQADWDAFTERFVEVTDRAYAIAANSDIDVYSNYVHVERRGKFKNKLTSCTNTKEFVQRFVDIYGDFRLSSLFGNGLARAHGKDNVNKFDAILASYGDMTVREFCQYNKLKPEGGDRLDAFKTNLPGHCGKPKKGGGRHSTNAAWDIIMCLAQKRTDDSGTYDSRLRKATQDAFKHVGELRYAMNALNGDQLYEKEIKTGVRMLSLLHLDAFNYAGLDSVHGFTDTAYGQEILGAKNAKELIDSRNRILISMRMDRLMKAVNKRDAAISDNTSNSETVENATYEVAKELRSLASSSNTWRIIVDDFIKDGALFQEFKKVAREAKADLRGYRNMMPYTNKETPVRFEWWDQDLPGDTLLEFISSRSGITFGIDDSSRVHDKDAAIADMVQYYTGIPTQPYEINRQLDTDPSPEFSTNPLQNPDGYNSTMEHFKEIRSPYSCKGLACKHTLQQIVKDTVNAFGTDEETMQLDDADIERFMHLRSHMWSWRGNVGADVYANAISLAVMDKAFDDTEKARQQDAINALFSSTFMARNGILVSDFKVCDDLMTGRISRYDLTRYPEVLARILGSDLEIEVYDERGSAMLSRKALGIESTADFRKWLIEHPRVAMAFAEQRSMPGKDMDGKVYAARVRSLSDTVLNGAAGLTMGDFMNEVRCRMTDHPSFASLVVALTGLGRKMENGQYTVEPSRTTTGRFAQGADIAVQYIVALACGADTSGKMFIESNGSEVADRIENEIHASLQGFVAETRGIMEELGVRFNSTSVDLSEAPDFVLHLDDVNTLSAYDDVAQMFTGAKTEISTSVNGGETRRLGMLPYFLMEHPEPCEAEIDEVPIDDLLVDDDDNRYIGAMLEDGTYLDYARIVMLEEQGVETVRLYDPAHCKNPLKPCKHHAAADQSLNSNPDEQVSAGAVLVTGQRANSTEANNLKVKKVGIDDLDSVSRIGIWEFMERADSWRVIGNQIRNTVMEEGIEAGRIEYAKKMRDFERELGYDDLTLAQYVGVAHLLLHTREAPLPPFGDEEENSETITEPVILSMHQLANIINRNMDKERAFSARSPKAIYDIVNKAVSDYLEGGSAFVSLEDAFSSVKVTTFDNSSLMGNLLLSRASSMERNFDLLRSGRYADKFASIETRIKHYETLGKNGDKAAANLARTAREVLESYEKNPDQSILSADHSRLDIKENDAFAVPVPQGPATMVYIAPFDEDSGFTFEGDKTLREFDWVLRQCQKYGTTLTINLNNTELVNYVARKYPNEYANAVLPIADYQADTRGDRSNEEENSLVLPFFDMELNGTISTSPYINAGTFFALDDRVTRIVESTQMMLGDAMYAGTDHAFGRMRAHKEGTYTFSKRTLFPTVMTEFDDAMRREQVPVDTLPGRMEIASREEILDRIRNVMLDSKSSAEAFEKMPPMDLGIDVQNPDRAAIAAKTMDAIQKYIFKISSSDGAEEGSLSDVEPGDIVGFAKLFINTGEGIQEWWAPVRPYQIAEGKGSPRIYDTSNLQIDETTGAGSVDWVHDSSLVGHFFKLFEWRNASNKGMVDGVPIKDHRLQHGHFVDFFIHHSSTESRRIKTLRNDTLYSLIIEARQAPFGYNFAELPNAFPDDPDIKEAVLTGNVNMDQWRQWLATPIKFIRENNDEDRLFNAWLNEQCEHAFNCGVSPDLWLASYYRPNGIDGERVDHHLHFMYDIMFRPNLTYEDMLLKFMNMMNPTICPPSMDAPENGELFRVNRDSSALQMLVPYEMQMDDGSWRQYFVPEYVLSGFSFMDQHYSGFSRPGVNPSHKSAASTLASAYWGRLGSKSDVDEIIKYTMSDDENYNGRGVASMILDPDNPAQKASGRKVFQANPKAKPPERNEDEPKRNVVVITGSRSITDRKWLYDRIKALNDGLNGLTLVTGHARGVDRLVEDIAKELHIDNVIMPADWDNLGGNAGFIRNDQMIDYAIDQMQHDPDCRAMTVGFWDGSSSGTAHALKSSAKKGLTVSRFMYGEEGPGEIVSKGRPLKRRRIERFRDDYAFLSNFYECPIEINGLQFDNAEAAFQHYKFEDPLVQSEFARGGRFAKASDARRAGTTAPNVRKDWERYRTSVMYKIVKAKFMQNEPLAKKLLDTGRDELVEGNDWNDTFWGECKGVGENHLGQILMQVRDELRKRENG